MMTLSIALGSDKKGNHITGVHDPINGSTIYALSHYKLLFVGRENGGVVSASNKRRQVYDFICCPSVIRHRLQSTRLVYSWRFDAFLRVHLLTGFTMSILILSVALFLLFLNSGSKSAANADGREQNWNIYHIPDTCYSCYTRTRKPSLLIARTRLRLLS